MGRVKQLQIELQCQEMAEYEELKEMGLEDKIIKLEEELREKKDEMKSLKDEEDLHLHDIDIIKDEILDLEKILNGSLELLERYKELLKIYNPVIDTDNCDIE